LEKIEVLRKLLRKLEAGTPLIIVGLGDPRIPNLHNFHPEKYRGTVRHLGFGYFEGETEHGKFSFYAGGAMTHYHFDNGEWLSYSPIMVDSPEVLKDLGYDFNRVIQALRDIIATLEAEEKEVAV